MALTRAQLLSGNTNQGIVLPGQVQGVSQGAGISIAPNGQISVDPSTVIGLLRTNNDSAFNGYVFPNTIPGVGTTFFTIDAAGVVSWVDIAGSAVTTVTAGNGLTGGGGPGAVTLDVGAGTGISVAADSVNIANTGVAAGSYTLANFTVNAQGQLTSASSSNPSSVSVTSVTAGNGLTGGGGPGSITLNVGAGTGISVAADSVNIANTGVTAGSYSTANITVNAQGQITSASNGSSGVTSVSGSGSGISVNPTTGAVVVQNTGVTRINAGSNITVSGNTGDITISASGGTGPIPSGSVMMFIQGSPPTGWTRAGGDLNDRALRLVSDTSGGGIGGSFGWQTFLISGFRTEGEIAFLNGATQAHTLTTQEIPSHAHQDGAGCTPNNCGNNFQSASNADRNITSGTTGGGSGHTHNLQGSIGDATIDFVGWNAKYVNVIAAVKD